MVELFKVEKTQDIKELKALIENHLKYTGSVVAEKVLAKWDEVLPQFVKVFPVDYRRVLEEEEKLREEMAKSREAGSENIGAFEE